MTEVSNYEATIRRIVNEGFRFSTGISNGLYELYYEWVKEKKNLTEEDLKYIELYPKLPKAKAPKKVDDDFDEDFS